MCSGFEQFKGKKKNKNQENFTVSGKKRLDSVETSIQNQNGFSVLTDRTSNNVQPNQTQEPAGVESVFREDYGFVDNAMNRNLVHNGSLVIGSVSDQAPEIHRPARPVSMHINDSLYQSRPGDTNADLIKDNTDTIRALQKRSSVLKGSLKDKWGEALFSIQARQFFTDNIEREVSGFGAITEPNKQQTIDEDLTDQKIAGEFNKEMNAENAIDCLYVDGIPMRQFVKEHYNFKREGQAGDMFMEMYASLIFSEGKHHMNIVKPIIRNGMPDVIITDLNIPMDPKEQTKRDKGLAKKKAAAEKLLESKRDEIIQKENIAYRKACGVEIEPLTRIESLKENLDRAGTGDSKAFKAFSSTFNAYFNAMERMVRGTEERSMDMDDVSTLKELCKNALNACNTYMKRSVNKKNEQRQASAKQIYARLSRDQALIDQNIKELSDGKGGLTKDLSLSELFKDTKELDAWEVYDWGGEERQQVQEQKQKQDRKQEPGQEQIQKQELSQEQEQNQELDQKKDQKQEQEAEGNQQKTGRTSNVSLKPDQPEGPAELPAGGSAQIQSGPQYINNAFSPLDVSSIDESLILTNTDLFQRLRKASNESTENPMEENFQAGDYLFSEQSLRFFEDFITEQLQSGLDSTSAPSSQQGGNASDKVLKQIARRFNHELEVDRTEDCLYVDGIPLRKYLEQTYNRTLRFDRENSNYYMKMYAPMLMADGKHQVNFVVPVIRDGRADVLISKPTLPITKEEQLLLDGMLSEKKAEIDQRLNEVKKELVEKANIAYKHACDMNRADESSNAAIGES